MPKFTFEEIKAFLLKCLNEYGCEAELSLKFSDKPNGYMIIIYEDQCSFQRCGNAKEHMFGAISFFMIMHTYYKKYNL